MTSNTSSSNGPLALEPKETSYTPSSSANAMSVRILEKVTHQLSSQLSSTPYASTDLTPLRGGTTNFVYRAVLHSALFDGSTTVIIKHTEGFAALNTAFEIAISRCEYEELMLRSLTASFPSVSTENNIFVETPTLHYTLSAPDHTIVMHDYNDSIDLKTYLLTRTVSLDFARCIGKALGSWTSKYHNWTRQSAQEALFERLKDSPMKELKYRINEGGLAAVVEKWPDELEKSRGLFEEVAKSGRDNMDRGETLIHGDFWSGNILIPGSRKDSAPILSVTDWELAHISHAFYDIGQMFAELYSLLLFRKIDTGMTIVEGFMQVYEMDEDMKWRVVVQIGVHLLCFSSRFEGMGDLETRREVLLKGMELVDRGWKKDEDWVRASFWKCLWQ